MHDPRMCTCACTAESRLSARELLLLALESIDTITDEDRFGAARLVGVGTVDYFRELHRLVDLEEAQVRFPLAVRRVQLERQQVAAARERRLRRWALNELGTVR